MTHFDGHLNTIQAIQNNISCRNAYAVMLKLKNSYQWSIIVGIPYLITESRMYTNTTLFPIQKP